MKKTLFILGQLSDQDVDWLARVGKRRDIGAGSAIIDQGAPAPALYLVLAGRFAVEIAGVPEPVAVMETGEVAGEMSFVDARPPSATVRATEDSAVLAVPVDLLRRQLKEEPAFAARFYLAIATFLSDRLRRMGVDEETVVDDLDEDVFGDDELDPGVLSNISLAGERFQRILRRLEEAG